MDEIGVQAALAGLDALQHRMRANAAADCSSPYAVFSARDRRLRIAATSPGIQFSPGVISYSRPARGHQLHADANAKERAAAAAHRFLERLDHAGDAIEAAPAIGEGADAGQDDMIGGGDDFRAAT